MRPFLATLLIVTACTSESIEPEEVASELTVSAIPRGSEWRYWDGGGDLGTSWRGGFDDATWSHGAGPLGYGESYLRTTISQGPITAYFRHSFTIDDPSAITELVGEVMYDDGFVVYLNGLEIGRGSMPSGTITASTLSTGHEANNAYRTYDWASHIDQLVAGTNVIAVEVHQASASSSDLVFDLGLSFEAESAPPPPSGDDIARGSAWWYWDHGGDQGTAWRSLTGAASGWDTGAGPLGYGESYLRTTVATGPITTYFRRTFTVDDPATVVAIAGEVMYDDGFVVYLNGTEISRGSMPSGTITASTLSTGHEANNAYRAYDWTARKDLLVAGVNVLAFEVHQASASSSDLVFDAALTIETGAPPPPPVELDGVERRSSWYVWDQGGTPDPSWKTQRYGSYPDWDDADGPAGYGESYLTTTVSYGSDPSNKHITTYFTKAFDCANPTAVTSMTAEVMYDDGFVAYLNGVEIARGSMPSGAVTSTTLATGHEANNAYVTIDVSAHADLLGPDDNVLAVEVHQQARSSSDLVFDMALRLLGEEPPPPSTDEDIARGSLWRFWDGAEAPSEYDRWAATDYNDAQWESGPGPLGYGESYLATVTDRGPITTYFRRWFTVESPTVRTRLIGELMYDDGVIVYLNGHEIARRQMPDDWNIGQDTLATTSHEAGNRYETHDWSDLSGLLVPGPNLIAVEVHQHSADSSDLVFDLSLSVDTPAVCAMPGGGSAVAPAPQAGLSDVWVGESTAFAVGGDGLVGRRSATGEWCWSRPYPDAQWSGVWGAADDDVWLAGAGGRVARYDGAGFTQLDAGTTKQLNAIWGSGPGDVWVVGVEGTVRHFDGTSWQGRDLPPDQRLYAVWGASVEDVYVSGREPAPYPGNEEYDGSSGVIYRWTGSAWSLQLRNTMYYGFADFVAIDGTSPTDIWAVGSDHPAGAACSIPTAFHYDGVSWRNLGAPECREFNDVAAAAPGAEDGAWVVGSTADSPGPGGAIRYTGGAWDEVISPEGFTGIDHDGVQTFAVGRNHEMGQYVVRWDGSRFVREW